MRIKYNGDWVEEMLTTGINGLVFKSSLAFRNCGLISHDIDEKIYDDTENGIFDTSHLMPTLLNIIYEKIQRQSSHPYSRL
jgi:hypothetical protein